MNNATFEVPASELAPQSELQITEIHYNPTESSPGADDSNDFEFIEIYNPHPTATIELENAQFSSGIAHTFGNENLSPGEYGVIVRNLAAFQARFGNSINVLGQWSSGGLNNGGETITFIDSAGLEIAEVEYGDSDPWAFAADGNGASLDLIDPVGTPSDLLDKPYSWRASVQVGGTPGAASTAVSGILINEILAHTDFPLSDSIELFNPTDSAIDISGWYLSDSGTEPLKYQVPCRTMILTPGGYVTFNENDFNPASPSGDQVPFALNAAEGDQVFLTEVTGPESSLLHDSISFEASFNGVTLGRSPDGSRMVPLASPSLGAINGGFAFDDILITEINYNPKAPDDGSITSRQLEFIEVSNTGATELDLEEWRIRGEVDFDFAIGQTLDSGASLLVVSFDPSSIPRWQAPSERTMHRQRSHTGRAVQKRTSLVQQLWASQAATPRRPTNGRPGLHTAYQRRRIRLR